MTFRSTQERTFIKIFLPEDTTIVDRELNATDISEATYNILSEWFKTQHPTKAYEDLLKSLAEVKLNLLVEELKGIVERERTTRDVGKCHSV